MHVEDSWRPTRLKPRRRADALKPGQRFRCRGRWYALRELEADQEHLVVLHTEQGPSLVVKAYEALEVEAAA